MFYITKFYRKHGIHNNIENSSMIKELEFVKTFRA